jgi:hypothetical protein
MELSLPDMPLANQRVPRSAAAGSAIEGAASAQRNARKPDQSGGAHGAEIDQVAGSLSLREREPFMVCATPVTPHSPRAPCSACWHPTW